LSETISDLEGLLGEAFQTTVDHEHQGYLRCNTLGHSWFDYDSNWTPMFGVPLTLRCERCGMERRDSINHYGELLNRHYTRPPGYQYAKGTRPTRSEFRVMLITQRIAESKKRRRK
jgi:hypothetical protein